MCQRCDASEVEGRTREVQPQLKADAVAASDGMEVENTEENVQEAVRLPWSIYREVEAGDVQGGRRSGNGRQRRRNRKFGGGAQERRWRTRENKDVHYGTTMEDSVVLDE